MNPEQQSEAGDSRKAAVINMLQQEGITDRTRDLFSVWFEERRVANDTLNSPRADIELNIEVAKLYEDAGLYDEAWDAFNEVRNQAANQGDCPDLMDKIDRMMNEFNHPSENQ